MMVLPVGRRAARTVAAPMVLPAPPWFSITIGRPSVTAMCSMTMRRHHVREPARREGARPPGRGARGTPLRGSHARPEREQARGAQQGHGG
jgi:hypothetical protein